MLWVSLEFMFRAGPNTTELVAYIVGLLRPNCTFANDKKECWQKNTLSFFSYTFLHIGLL